MAADSPFGARLRMARLAAGLSLADLARRTGHVVSRQAIHRYETGIMKPSSRTLLALCRALGVPPDYFFRQIGSRNVELNFRGRIGLPAKKVSAIRFRTLDFLERYRELESLLHQDAPFRNPLQGTSTGSQADIERAAARLRKAWHMGDGPVCSLFEIIEENGIKIFEIEEDESFDGMSARAGRQFMIVINRLKTPDRRRFTAAHELGHILCGFAQTEDAHCHDFAKALLLPKEAFIRELHGNRKKIALTELIAVKEKFGVSIQAILHRAFDLGLISARYRSAYEKQLAEYRAEKAEPGQCPFDERASRFRRLLTYSVSENLISLSQAAQLAELSLPRFEREYLAV